MRTLVLASGSTGNALLLQWSGGAVLIDAGISARRIRTMLRNEGIELSELSAILITHDHSDHISGLRVLLRQCSCPVFALAPVSRVLKQMMPEHLERILDAAPDGIAISDGRFTPIPTMHDAAASCGWRGETPEGIFGLCTDLGIITEEVLDGLCGADIAMIESNHDPEMLRTGPYPPVLKRRIASEYGHLSNEDAADLAVFLCSTGTEQLILGHISRHNNTPGLALNTVSAALRDALPEVLWAELDAAPELGPLVVERKVGVACSQ